MSHSCTTVQDPACSHCHRHIAVARASGYSKYSAYRRGLFEAHSSATRFHSLVHDLRLTGSSKRVRIKASGRTHPQAFDQLRVLDTLQFQPRSHVLAPLLQLR